MGQTLLAWGQHNNRQGFEPVFDTATPYYCNQ
jgi:hypothetical protein